MVLHDRGGGLNWSIQDKANRALAKIGGPAVPLLRQALTSESDHHRAIAAFALKLMTLEQSAAALPAKAALEKAMRDENVNVKVDAALAYWNLSREAEEVRPLLISVIREYLKDPDHAPRAAGRFSGEWSGEVPQAVEAAVIGLRYLQAAAAPAIELLIDILKGKSRGHLHLYTVETLGELGDVATPAIPQLKEMSTTPDATMREAVEDALEKITSGHKQ